MHDTQIRIKLHGKACAAGEAAAAPLLVSGTVAYDTIETPRAKGTRILGGSASYAALAASYFTDVRIEGLVGGDFAQRDWQRLRARGVDTSGLHVAPAGETFFWHGRYGENLNRRETLETRLGVNAQARPPLPCGHNTTPFVLLANDAPALQLAVLEQLASPRFVLADTMNLWIETALAPLREVIRRADLLIINDDEATQLTGETNLFNAAAKIHADYHARHLLIKKGEHGAMLFYDEPAGAIPAGTPAFPSLFILPAHPVTNLHDPTGAGDSFAGAFMGTLAALQRTDFEAMKLAMLYASAVASLTVEAFSCDRLETAGPSEISQRADNIRRLTQIPGI
ncbi:MAG: PfkB family carbohydrate kinase [Puniceicoccales bacterium]|jgi:sugar/nucleoside kinase (ribokinase family)|nr:PfkB family carbohydrate kinase [Puniceicoccales bacterium]